MRRIKNFFKSIWKLLLRINKNNKQQYLEERLKNKSFKKVNTKDTQKFLHLNYLLLYLLQTVLLFYTVTHYANISYHNFKIIIACVFISTLWTFIQIYMFGDIIERIENCFIYQVLHITILQIFHILCAHSMHLRMFRSLCSGISTMSKK